MYMDTPTQVLEGMLRMVPLGGIWQELAWDKGQQEEGKDLPEGWSLSSCHTLPLGIPHPVRRWVPLIWGWVPQAGDQRMCAPFPRSHSQ